ncbi:MAG: hypothetical protein ACREI8_09430 [Myxococcota bacterium]
MADHVGVTHVPTGELGSPDPDALRAIPRELAARFRLFGFRCEGEMLHVAMGDPWDREAAEALLHATGLGIRPYVVSEIRLRRLFHATSRRSCRRSPRAGNRPARARGGADRREALQLGLRVALGAARIVAFLVGRHTGSDRGEPLHLDGNVSRP